MARESVLIETEQLEELINSGEKFYLIDFTICPNAEVT
jgi:hypothetical protein